MFLRGRRHIIFVFCYSATVATVHFRVTHIPFRLYIYIYINIEFLFDFVHGLISTVATVTL